MPADIRIGRIVDALPAGFPALAASAKREGVRNMEMLEDDWATGRQRFVGVGEGLFAAWSGVRLVGVGGVTIETNLDEAAMRMRRFYVSPDWRARGVGKALAGEVIAYALKSANVLTANAQASAAAGPFWEAMGFAPLSSTNVTHIFRAPLDHTPRAS